MTMIHLAQQVKESSFELAATSAQLRNQALDKMIQYLSQEKETIFKANEKDLALGKESQLHSPLLNRLKFDSHKLREVTEGIQGLIQMEDPLHKILLKRQVDADEKVQELSWKAQVRLCGRYQRLLQKGKSKGKVITCIARELAGFIWALGNIQSEKQAA